MSLMLAHTFVDWISFLYLFPLTLTLPIVSTLSVPHSPFVLTYAHPPHGIKSPSPNALTPLLSCLQSTLLLVLDIIPYQ
jgi:hypothetical protein